ncbi:hypothetical protein SAMN05892877_117155 [Rhizobium subbaraonis]|uniref:Tail tube protein n=1 Tax=Rhizobium subbaraonis TaxID=908946 RepID=A0A285UYG0_9HYPH|nr:hypothetical protein [Rhizobium subbaraonis]SOC45766.1 hypothetical protein SAMN05892877_117155 [Rhizobium subbaraonis]
MQLYPVAGSRLYMGAAVSDVPDEDLDEADFSSVVWTEIKGWQTMGAFGDAKTLITESIINRSRDLKAGGTRNAGSMQNNFIVLPTDTGQLALIAAEATDYNYPFKIVFDDAPPTGSAPTPSEAKFMGIVMTANEQGGGANTARLLQGTVEINTNIVRKPAATGS